MTVYKNPGKLTDLAEFPGRPLFIRRSMRANGILEILIPVKIRAKSEVGARRKATFLELTAKHILRCCRAP